MQVVFEGEVLDIFCFSAFGIRGLTLHRLFKLPVQHGKRMVYFPLNKFEQKELSMSLKHLKLLVVDEIRFEIVAGFLHLVFISFFSIQHGFKCYARVLVQATSRNFPK